MTENSNGRSFGLFALVLAAAAIIGLPLFGVVRSPWAHAPTPAPEPPPDARAEAKPSAPAREVASATPVRRKKTRIVWVGGGSSGSSSDCRPAPAPKANDPSRYRIPVSPGGSTLQIQPVGGYIATTAAPAQNRRTSRR